MQNAILFDFDGVLADTFEFCYEIIKSFDPALTHEEYRKRFLGNINEHKSEKQDEARKKNNFDFFAHYTPKLLALEIDPGIKTLVLGLSKKYSLFIVSSTNTDPIKAFLEQNSIVHCFQGIYGNDIHKSKIEKIGMVLEKYALAPNHCLFITDTVGDIREARKCNVNSVAVSWGYHLRETLKEEAPTAVVDSIEDLKAAIEKALY